VSGGSVQTVKRVLNEGADVNSRDERGATALHKAVREGQKDVVKILLEFGADVTIEDEGGDTPMDLLDREIERGWKSPGDNETRVYREMLGLFYASKSYRAAFVKTDGEPPLVFHNVAEAEVFLGHGGDVNVRDINGATMLHNAAGISAIQVHAAPDRISSLRNSELVEFLIDRGARVNARDREGRTPLHLAAKVGDSEIVNSLLAHGAHVNARDLAGYAPLNALVAARALARRQGGLFYGSGEFLETAELILRGGGDAGAKPAHGMTPLNVAASNGDKEFVEILVRHGAHVNGRDMTGESPLHHAARGSMREVNIRCRAAGARNGTMYQAYRQVTSTGQPTQWKYRDTAEILLLNGGHVDAANNLGGTPLHVAARSCNHEVAELLLANGADVNAKTNDGETPLRGLLQAVELLEGRDDRTRAAPRRATRQDMCLTTLELLRENDATQ
jgi:cytohesin